MSVLEVLTAAAQSGLIAVNKPAGMLVIPGRNDSEGPAARQVLEAQLGRNVWVVHRLDRDTSGVVVFALDAASHRTASMAFEHGDVSKRYLAIVQGRIETELDLRMPLMEARKRRMKVAPAGAAGAKEARTVVRPKEVFANATLVECEPFTGRQHQIRVHLAASGYPLLFDHQYGLRTPLTLTGGVVLARTPLHAASLELSSMGFSASAPMPEDLQIVLSSLR